MSNIGVKVINQTAVLTNTEDIYSGDINTDTITFDFCNHWDGFVKTAIFYRTKDKPYQQLLNEDNSCTIPPEVLIEGAIINIGVYGVKDDQVLTSQIIRYRIKEGAICESIKIENPTLTIYAQIIAQYSEILANQGDFIESQNQTVNGFIESQNQTMNNFIESQNQTMSDYQTSWLQTVEDTRTEMIDEVNDLVERAEVFDAETLNGHNSEYFAIKEELCELPVQTTYLSASGWYRIATLNTRSAYGCILSVGNAYGSGGGTSYTIALNGTSGKNVLTQLSGNVTNATIINKVRCVGVGGTQIHIEIYYNSSKANQVYVQLGNIWGNGNAVSIPFTAGEIPDGYTATELELVSNYTPFHTGNKPTGSYTGNGDATTRTINVGGIGNAVLVTSGIAYAMLVTPVGAIGITSNGTTHTVKREEVHFTNGVLTITTTSGTVNYNGTTYTYQLL